MEATTEEPLTNEMYPAEEALLKETWPIPLDDMVKEFEEYLMDIGLRF